jgi:hypothetical protein
VTGRRGRGSTRSQCGELALEEAMNLSYDRLQNERMNESNNQCKKDVLKYAELTRWQVLQNYELQRLTAIFLY